MGACATGPSLNGPPTRTAPTVKLFGCGSSGVTGPLGLRGTHSERVGPERWHSEAAGLDRHSASVDERLAPRRIGVPSAALAAPSPPGRCPPELDCTTADAPSQEPHPFRTAVRVAAVS